MQNDDDIPGGGGAYRGAGLRVSRSDAPTDRAAIVERNRQAKAAEDRRAKENRERTAAPTSPRIGTRAAKSDAVFTKKPGQ